MPLYPAVMTNLVGLVRYNVLLSLHGPLLRQLLPQLCQLRLLLFFGQRLDLSHISLERPRSRLKVADLFRRFLKLLMARLLRVERRSSLRPEDLATLTALDGLTSSAREPD